MKLLFTIFLGLFMAQAHAYRVLWWNMGGGNFLENPASAAYDNEPMEMSLVDMVSEKNPNMIVLGEYFDGFISKATHQKISKSHPYQQVFKYNAKRSLEIAVFSKKPFQYSYNQGFLTWKKELKPEDSKKDYYNRRSFQRIVLKIKEREINLVPLHTMMPWTDMMTNNRGLSWISPKLGKYEVGYEILFSTKNPLGHQAKQFKGHLQNSMATSPKADWVVFGDFNIPSDYAMMETEIFKVLRGPLKKGTRVGENKYSFPYPGTQASKKFAIDHAVSNLGARLEYQYLRYPGSDHFPMLIDL